MAWTRFEWFAPLQGHTFVLPWIGYIVLINAWNLKCAGCSLLTDTRWRFIGLIAGSALFWWFFEYLNRFVENWYYTGLQDMGPLAYAFFASLAFATVLPAVLSTQYALLTLSCFGLGLQTNQLFLGYDGGPLAVERNLKLTVSATNNDNPLTLQIKMAPAGSMVLERSTNAVEWEPIYTNGVWASSVTWIDPPLPGQSLRLYRARAHP